jgi:hypothetical protein
MALGAEPRVGEDLRDGIASRGTPLGLIGAAHRADEVGRVVIGDVLQGVGDARHEIIFANQGHELGSQ